MSTNNFFEDLRKYATTNNVPIIYEDGMTLLEEVITSQNVLSILEIGTAIGYSASRMASLNSKIKIETVEISKEMYQQACKNVKNIGLDKQITLHHADGLEFETTKKFDMIFIDAAKSQYIRFFEKFKTNLNDNGFIITDNLDFHGYVKQVERIESKNLRQLVGKIRRYIDFLEQNTEFETEFFDIGDGIAISKKVKQ